MNTSAAVFLLVGLVGLVLFVLLARARALSPLAWTGILIGSGITGAIMSLSA